MARDAVSLPLGDRQFLFMVAAIIGATFNPWMIFYQQSATVDKRLQPGDLGHARADTAVGAVLTQCLTGAVLVAAAATFAYSAAPASLSSVGEISRALTPALGATAGKFIFGAGVLGASLVAAIVASLALAWGVGEIVGLKRTLENQPFAAGWFYGVYALAVVGSALAVWAASDLVWLNIAAQVLNAFLMPLVVGFLVALAARALPEPYRVARLAASARRRRLRDRLGARRVRRAARVGLTGAALAERQRRFRDAGSNGVTSDQKALANLLAFTRYGVDETHLAEFAQDRRKEAIGARRGAGSERMRSGTPSASAAI